MYLIFEFENSEKEPNAPFFFNFVSMSLLSAPDELSFLVSLSVIYSTAITDDRIKR